MNNGIKSSILFHSSDSINIFTVLIMIMPFIFTGCSTSAVISNQTHTAEIQNSIIEGTIIAPVTNTPIPDETQTAPFPIPTQTASQPYPRLAVTIDNVPFDDEAEPIVYTIRANGTEFMRLVEDPEITCCPSWSPDGKYIAFLGHNPDEWFYHLYILEYHTGEIKQSPIEHVGVFTWAPDSQSIAFTEEAPRIDYYSAYYPSKINIINISTLETHLLNDAPWAVVEMEWSAFGNEIALLVQEGNGSQSFRIMDIAGNVSELPLYPSVHYDIDWHPYDSIIAYSVEPRDILSNGLNGICTISSDGTNSRLLLETDGLTSNPQWSPSNGIIAYEMSTPLANPIGIYITYLDNNLTRLVSPDGIQSLNPTWSNEGQYLAFISAIDVYERGYSLLVYDIERQITEQIIDGHLTADKISWQPTLVVTNLP
jgi:Tol biopolymer transport system component